MGAGHVRAVAPPPFSCQTGCGGGAAGILTRGHDNTLINCLGTSEGRKWDYMLVVRVLELNLSASHVGCERTIGYRPYVVLRARPSVRKTSLLSASFTQYGHGLEGKN